MQRANISFSYSCWEDILEDMPQASILGPRLFNIFLCDLFLEFQDNFFANYTDDTTPYTAEDNTEEVITELTNTKLFSWFSDNQMKVKCNLLLSTSEPLHIQKGGAVINSLQTEKLLGMHFHSKLKSDTDKNEI